jgi:REP element-mobilizing transposase RayT
MRFLTGKARRSSTRRGVRHRSASSASCAETATTGLQESTPPDPASTVDGVPRPPRDWVPGGAYHVFSRGSNRDALFFYDEDRFDLLDYTTVVVERYDLECLAYVFMTNHVHYLFRTPPEPLDALSKALRDLNGRYARRFNKRHGREAHAFKNRFGAFLKESVEEVMWTARYIVRNPVEAGLCAHPAQWPWSSYRATVGLESPPAFLSVPALLSLFASSDERAVARYVAYLAEPAVSDTGREARLGYAA